VVHLLGLPANVFRYLVVLAASQRVAFGSSGGGGLRGLVEDTAAPALARARGVSTTLLDWVTRWDA